MASFTDKIKASFDAWIAKQELERNKKKPKKGTGSIATPIPYKKGGGLCGGGQRGQLGKLEDE